MDLKQLENILKIAEENNITRAAEKLFLTQSALNQQLLRLERELGTLLFYRSRTDWRPTEEGNVYLQAARDILQIKRQAYSKINDMATTRRGNLSVGLTPGRGIAMFTAVYPAFHHKYPNIMIEPKELSVRNQQQQIAQGDLDIGFMTLRQKDKTVDCYETIYSEEFFVVIPIGHPLGRLAAPPGKPYAIIDISLLKYEPFVLMSKDSTSRHLEDACFREHGFIPNVLFETSSTETIVNMVASSLSCGLVPHYYAKKAPDKMACFALKNHPSWDITVSYKRGAYLSQAAKEFIQLASDHWLQHSDSYEVII